ncbi:MAG TPA: TIGR04255 family protein [Tepidisphaeraceae bacterium]|nr:TIGR04255 family protein [Tepidisphaeraceae bacterium]
MEQEDRPLPEYDAPPVDEVVLGVEFPAIDGWRVPHAGLFWHDVRADYPKCEVRPPLPSQVEQFPGSVATASAPTICLITDPNAIRCWFLDEAENNLIQIQPDRFLRNWRQVRGDEQYPRYARLRPSFERDWTRFEEFLEGEGLPAARPIQCEVTYINNIERGNGWDSFSDLANVTSLWAGGGDQRFLQGPESANMELSYTMEEGTARLRVALNHAIRIRDNKEVIQLQLIARGKPASSSTSDVLAWMDRGRAWIVQAFTDLTTPAMHKIWRRKV